MQQEVRIGAFGVGAAAEDEHQGVLLVAGEVHAQVGAPVAATGPSARR
ncbi:hypothetical protein ACIP93_18965 [Streptomyces sp. NPDC088745]